VLSDSTQQFTNLWRGGSWGYYMIWRVQAQGPQTRVAVWWASVFSDLPRSLPPCCGEEAMEIMLFGRPGLWALIITLHQMHAGIEFMGVVLSAFRHCPQLTLWCVGEWAVDFTGF
jgi:hypothetical protein